MLIMVQKNDNTLAIVLIVLLFGGFGFGMMGNYGSPWMCSHMGGIWCYWPTGGLFMLIMPALIIVALVLFIVWLVKQIQK